MSAVTRRQSNGMGATIAMLIFVLAAAAATLIPTFAAWLATGEVTPVSPLALLSGQESWTPLHTTATTMLGGAFLAVLVVAGAAMVWSGRGRAKEDRAARHFGTGQHLGPLLPKRVAETHRRMGWDPAVCRGIHLGISVADRQPLRASFETTGVMIAGPGRNKTTAMIIPNILDAPGTVITTSVRPDVFETTAGYRSTVGQVHVFDPQGNAPGAEGYHVWWNALAGVHRLEDAEALAAVLAANYIDESGANKYFEVEGTRLVADYIFAAAVAGEYLPAVQAWLRVEDSPVPVRALRESFPEVAARIDVAQKQTPRTRNNVFSYARGAVAFLADERLASWVRPGGGRRELRPEELVTAPKDTLYLLGKQGRGSAGPLISALTKTLLDTAERLSEASPSARLPMPLLVLLDEAGNICRIPDLPERYSHYRDRGIVVVTILQSDHQGKQVWPHGGFEALLAAAMWWVFAGGNASAGFYRDVSELIGDYSYQERSASSGRNGGSVQVATRTERIMDVSDLDSLTFGRMIVFASGARPALVRAQPWFKSKRLRALAAMRPTLMARGGDDE